MDFLARITAARVSKLAIEDCVPGHRGASLELGPRVGFLSSNATVLRQLAPHSRQADATTNGEPVGRGVINERQWHFFLSHVLTAVDDDDGGGDPPFGAYSS